jgi:putative hemolysin
VPAEVVRREVERLAPDCILLSEGQQSVYVAAAPDIPGVLREIGRLREVCFRAVGEGTGRAIDLDEFDERYLHLFVWSDSERQIVGAYRVGLTDRILAERGVSGLYTSTLFEFDPGLLHELGPALELGRSFVRPEWQRSYTPLLLLWRGIAELVLRDPRYATLFGPVSISAAYSSASQRVILDFLEQNHLVHVASHRVRARNPPASVPSMTPPGLDDLKALSRLVADGEADRKGVPVLLRQYLKLGGRLLGFNVDPAFGHVLDVLIVVDLRRTPRRTLARYMGPTGSARFLAHHAAHPFGRLHTG